MIIIIAIILWLLNGNEHLLTKSPNLEIYQIDDLADTQDGSKADNWIVPLA